MSDVVIIEADRQKSLFYINRLKSAWVIKLYSLFFIILEAYDRTYLWYIDCKSIVL